MRFWLLAVMESGPVRLGSIAVRTMAWLLIVSAAVIWWGPGDDASSSGRALAGLLLGAVLWVFATLPRWIASAIEARSC